MTLHPNVGSTRWSMHLACTIQSCTNTYAQVHARRFADASMHACMRTHACFQLTCESTRKFATATFTRVLSDGYTQHGNASREQLVHIGSTTSVPCRRQLVIIPRFPDVFQQGTSPWMLCYN